MIFSWALYDLANQFFVLNVISLYFIRWLTLEKKIPEIFYSISFGASMLLVAVLSPLLGTASDAAARRRLFLVYCTLLSVAFTMLLGVTQSVFFSLLCFAIANFGCQLAVVFYNALLVDVAPPGRIGAVSGLGRVLGYAGAIVALFAIRPAVERNGYQAAFLPSGILFLVFSLPCMLFVKDKAAARKALPAYSLVKGSVTQILSSLRTSVSAARGFPGLSDFLKAMFFGLSAVNAIILFMSVYVTRVFRLGEAQIINLIAFSALFAIGGSLISGLVSDYIGYGLMLRFVFILWIICFFTGALIKTAGLYWLIGALVGIALGSLWVVSRALCVRLVPQEKAGQAFGLFSLVGYLSAVSGALFWGIAITLLGSLGGLGYRIGLFSLIWFMAVGCVYLLRLPGKGRSANG